MNTDNNETSTRLRDLLEEELGYETYNAVAIVLLVTGNEDLVANIPTENLPHVIDSFSELESAITGWKTSLRELQQ